MKIWVEERNSVGRDRRKACPVSINWASKFVCFSPVMSSCSGGAQSGWIFKFNQNRNFLRKNSTLNRGGQDIKGSLYI